MFFMRKKSCFIFFGNKYVEYKSKKEWTHATAMCCDSVKCAIFHDYEMMCRLPGKWTQKMMAIDFWWEISEINCCALDAVSVVGFGEKWMKIEI